MASAGFAMAWWLLSALPSLPKAAEKATARQGAIQTALALAAGIGAAITLMLAFRRQRHQEHAAHVTAYLTERNAHLAEQVAEHNRQDATERRVTELYTKAVEQLGHATAAVRLGGLYALERLAQDNHAHRQTIVNVICAYLRMPYTPPPGTTQQDQAPAVPRAAVAGASSTPTAGHDPREELQVRLTAQRILAEHLRDGRTLRQRETKPAGPRLWEGMHIDLTDATLIDLDFTSCRLTQAQFDRAIFKGSTNFTGATFEGYGWFAGATFEEETWFGGAIFKGDAGFEGATFKGDAMLGTVTFAADIWFERAIFEGRAHFNGVTTRGAGRFDGVQVLQPDVLHHLPAGWVVIRQQGGSGVFQRNDTEPPPLSSAQQRMNRPPTGT